MGNGIFGTTEGIKGQSNVVMETGISIVQGDGLANQAYGHVVAADLVGDESKKMEAIDVTLIDREDFPVVAFSCSKLTGLMMPLRRGQPLGNLNRGAGGCALRRRKGVLLPFFRPLSSLFSVHGEAWPTSLNDCRFGENDSNCSPLGRTFPRKFFL